MTGYQQTGTAGGLAPPAAVKVWDPFVRIFHWSLVSLFVIAFLTGDESERIHNAAGYAIAALLALRIVWGFIGPKHARFSDFVKSPRRVMTFITQSLTLSAPRSLGHNPAGAVMILTLIAALIGLCATGILMTTDANWGSKALEEVHEAFAYGTLGLIALHVLGVVFSSFEHRENLVKAMVTGKKREV
jgi:cytochrome b